MDVHKAKEKVAVLFESGEKIEALAAIFERTKGAIVSGLNHKA